MSDEANLQTMMTDCTLARKKTAGAPATGDSAQGCRRGKNDNSDYLQSFRN